MVQTQEARQALRDIEERHHEIVTLERNIRDMRDLFVEISLHVEAQVGGGAKSIGHRFSVVLVVKFQSLSKYQ